MGLGELVLPESKPEVQTDIAVPPTVIDETEIRDRADRQRAGDDSGERIDAVGLGSKIRGFGPSGTFGTDKRVEV